LLSQQFQPGIARFGRTRLAFRAVGEVQVFQRLLIPGFPKLLLQPACKIALLPDGFEDGLTPLFDRLQAFMRLLDLGYGLLIQVASLLLPVAGNEGQGAPLLEKLKGLGNL
jgi:hypothetical protein